jgi:hypothetical protein
MNARVPEWLKPETQGAAADAWATELMKLAAT